MSEVIRKTNPKIDYYHALLTLTAKKKKTELHSMSKPTN